MKVVMTVFVFLSIVSTTSRSNAAVSPCEKSLDTLIEFTAAAAQKSLNISNRERSGSQDEDILKMYKSMKEVAWEIVYIAKLEAVVLCQNPGK